MRAHTDLLDAVTKLQALQSEIVKISHRDDHGRKMDLVKLRRDLSQQLGVVSAAADPVLKMPEFGPLAPQFRTMFSTMRNAVALHQANWPAVRLDEAGADYDASVAAVRKANTAFAAWVKANLQG